MGMRILNKFSIILRNLEIFINFRIFRENLTRSFQEHQIYGFVLVQMSQWLMDKCTYISSFSPCFPVLGDIPLFAPLLKLIKVLLKSKIYQRMIYIDPSNHKCSAKIDYIDSLPWKRKILLEPVLRSLLLDMPGELLGSLKLAYLLHDPRHVPRPNKFIFACISLPGAHDRSLYSKLSLIGVNF